MRRTPSILVKRPLIYTDKEAAEAGVAAPTLFPGPAPSGPYLVPQIPSHMPKDFKTGSGDDSDSPPRDLESERERFVQSFTRGSKLTEEFIHEYERLLNRLQTLEGENATLRAQVEAISNQFTSRVREVESEFSNLANLYVASNQLHSSLTPRGVTRRIKEVLAQLVGAERYSMYLANPEGSELVPIAFEGVPGGELTPMPVAGSKLGEVFQSGKAAIQEDSDPSQGAIERPAAVIPLVIDDRIVGVIAIFSTLSQKTRFDAVDFELFRLLGQQAAAALVSASLFAQADRRLPGLEAFLDLSV
ncbi:MAG TPA: GAF domain-containing protein [Polyangiaceae bacterium]